MRPTLSLIRREFNAYFYSPIAYVVLALFLAVTGHQFYRSMDQLTETGPRGIAFPMELMVGDVSFWLVYLFIPPLLTMRLFAEERSTGTLEMLLTAPVRDWQVVFAKYVACYGFYLIMWLPTLLYLPVLTDWHWSTVPISADPGAAMSYGIIALAIIIVAITLFGLCFSKFSDGEALAGIVAGLVALVVLGLGGAGTWWIVNEGNWWTVECGIDPSSVLTTYLGIALAGAMFLAIGMLISSFVNSQMLAAIISLFVCLVFIVVGIWQPEMDTSSLEYQVLYFFTVPEHFRHDFSRGIIDSRAIVLYCTTALFCCFLTVRSLESRRWR
jgi:ABC-type transport system involved in multi-copper enzyme maturation permease subunit